MQRTAGAAKLQMGGVLDSRSLFANPRAKLSRKVTAVLSIISALSTHFPVVSKTVCHVHLCHVWGCPAGAVSPCCELEGCPPIAMLDRRPPGPADTLLTNRVAANGRRRNNGDTAAPP